MLLQDYFNSIIGKCFHYSSPLEYPHGRMVAIVPAEYRGGFYEDTLICYISFTDGYMGSYSYRADKELARIFKNLKRF